MIDTHKHQTALKVYKDHMNDLWIYKDRNEEHQHGAYKFRQKDWQVKRFINDVHRGGFALKTMKNAYDDAMEEVKRLRLLFRELINDMSADEYIEWCNKIGCPNGLEVEAIE